eukprot:Skav222235  [mRNA]  locus=scaffold3059:49406:52188:- [translate_table: standard]
MVDDHDWAEVATNLVRCGICEVIPDSEIFCAKGQAVRNGLFGVEKGETHAGFPTYRLIMNLVPLNALALPMDADIHTLPHWMGMNPFSLNVAEGLLVSSEDIRCFFYTLKLPRCWLPFLSFNKEVPKSMRPKGCNEPCFLTAKVLPMGFLNSVGVAQHVHRVLVSRSSPTRDLALANTEIRKDRVLPEGDVQWRVYLDNYDLLEKFPKESLASLEGSLAAEVADLRSSYKQVGLPRHEGKAVSRSSRTEVQGAIIDGVEGIAFPKGDKLIKYVVMGLLLVKRGWCRLKELQVVCGGLVYFSLFRRQLLGGLNAVWSFMQSFELRGRARLPLPAEVKLEILRFIGLVPLCRLDFRLPLQERVSCSDASQTGGGLCISSGLSALGHLVSRGSLRPVCDPCGNLPSVLSIGLFDGVGCLRVALDLVGAQVAGHISVEKQETGRKVVEYHFPTTIHVNDVNLIDEEMVRTWSLKFGQVALVLIGGGPPCQGVSGLNSRRRGALGDERSCLFVHVPRVAQLVRRWFCWAQVHTLMESVSSMDQEDKNVMSTAFGCEPWDIGAEYMTWCRRPRLYWVTWNLWETEGVTLQDEKAFFEAELPLKSCIRQGWSKVDEERAFPTGYPQDIDHLDTRHTLVGNAWSVPVVSVLVGQLLQPLGMCVRSKPQEIINALLMEHQTDVRSRLLRPGLNPVSLPKIPKGDLGCTAPEFKLASLLSRLVSSKGEDLLLNSSTDQVASFQRLRQTVPSRLWHWRTISGWKWRHTNEHINSLELRAVLASVRWRVEHRHELHCKFVHLTDSLVSLHAASRGRSSSKRLRRTMCRLNAVLLAAGVTPLWGYVHTDQNPADKPSRWSVRAKFRNA